MMRRLHSTVAPGPVQARPPHKIQPNPPPRPHLQRLYEVRALQARQLALDARPHGLLQAQWQARTTHTSAAWGAAVHACTAAPAAQAPPVAVQYLEVGAAQ